MSLKIVTKPNSELRLPNIEFHDSCPECEWVCVENMDSGVGFAPYLSYEDGSTPMEVGMCCRKCGHEWVAGHVLLKVEIVQPKGRVLLKPVVKSNIPLEVIQAAVREVKNNSASTPSFNHTRADGFYNPCDLCWAQMNEEDKRKSVLGMSSDPYGDRCILDVFQSSGIELSPYLDELRAEYQERDDD